MEQTANQKIITKQITGLNGLRGIAVLGVAGYHLFPHTVTGGFLGVNLFMVLSGYLMAVTSRREQTQTGFRVSSFYRKRVCRIYPALILTIFATAFCAFFLAPDVLRGIRGEVFSIVAGSNNWWQIIQNASYFTRIASTSPFVHLWSLAIEMQFYLIWPILFLLYMMLKRIGQNAALLFYLFALVSVLEMALLFRNGEDPTRIYYGTDTRISALLIGSALGLTDSKGEKRNRQPYRDHIKLFLFSLTLTGVILLYFLADGQSEFTYRAGFTFFTLMSAMLIAICADRKLPYGRWLDCPPLAWLGKRSYEIYLVQYPVIFFFHRSGPTASVLCNTLLAIALILLIAQWIHCVPLFIMNDREI